DPANFDAAYLLAVTEQEVYDYPASLPFFEQALVINPQSTDARYAFAWSLQKAKYPQDAADELEKLLQQTPNDPKANLLLATLYAQSLNQPKLARDHYLRVLQADPHNSQATAIRFWLAANP
ncbi:MAG: tetratricopeptide repeat protein, partial [Limisphaerales bacterium]